VTREEADLFLRLVPGACGTVHVIENGVDADYFSPAADRASPYAANEAPIVFTGAMDYWPNIDAVAWFAADVMPRILESRPDARFYVVGMNPAPAVVALAARPGIVITGAVPDVRPYVQHASAVVAPLRVARGIQNKILEAMAMARPVVASGAAGACLRGDPEREFAVAESPGDFAARTLGLLDFRAGNRMGELARARILADYAWESNLAEFDRLLDEDGTGGQSRRAR